MKTPKLIRIPVNIFEIIPVLSPKTSIIPGKTPKKIFFSQLQKLR